MDRMQQLIIWCAVFICICGEDEGSSCDVTFTVRRRMTKRVIPGQSLTVNCPLKHCGNVFHITWCKLSNGTHCEILPDTENISIRQENHKDVLISYLSFNQVSITDGGRYQCALENRHESVSHAINISVSDLNKGVENLEDDVVSSKTHVDNGSWLPYFLICSSIVLLVTTGIVLNHVGCYARKRTRTCNTKKQEEKSSHMIPELPKRSDQFSPILQTQFSGLNDFSYFSKGEITTSPSSTSTDIENSLAVVNRAAKIQESNSEVYAIINHQHPGQKARKYTCKQDESTYYAVINVS